MLGQWKLNNRSAGVSAAEPSVVFVVKSLLHPIVAVLALLISLLAWGEPLAGPYIIVAVFAFVGVADFLDVAQIRGQTRMSIYRTLIDTSLRWSFVVGFIWVLLYISGLMRQLNSDALLTWVVVTPVMLWLGQLLAFYLGLRHLPPRRAVVVGLTELGLRLEGKLREDPLLCTEVMGFFEDRSPDRLPVNCQQKILGKPSQLPEFILQNAVNVVYITLPMTRDPRIMGLLETLRDSTVSIYFAPDIFMFNLIQARFDQVSGIPVVAVRESPFYGVRGAAKRLCDCVIASAAILGLLPLFLAVAIGVRLSSSSSILFKQKRYGLDGKPIIVYKFRSMTVAEDGESSYSQVARNDARVTRFGAFIRRTSLDELPQFFNVLEGSMSIVGPRPHAVAVNEQYRRLIPSYMIRHKVKPGITGWAQIHGYRGGDDLESMTKRVDLDLEYLCHWSLALDMMIIVKTAALVWTDRRAY
jgi:putative colanic acid biosysnthesis UDP-glucose lipid carrier transferase